MDPAPAVAVMVPVGTRKQAPFQSIWASWYQLDYPKDRIAYFFAIPETSPYLRFVKERFNRPHQVIPLAIKYEGEQKDRFAELAAVRNLLLEYGRGFDYGLFLDSDVMPPPNAIRCFLEDQADIVGGIVRVPDAYGVMQLGFGNFTPYFNFGTNIPSEFFQVGSVNTACMFLSHDVMNNEKVGFEMLYVDLPTGRQNMSEDHCYCLSAAKAGYTIWVDSRVKCKHLRFWNGRLITLGVEAPVSNKRLRVS